MTARQYTLEGLLEGSLGGSLELDYLLDVKQKKFKEGMHLRRCGAEVCNAYRSEVAPWTGAVNGALQGYPRIVRSLMEAERKQ